MDPKYISSCLVRQKTSFLIFFLAVIFCSRCAPSLYGVLNTKSQDKIISSSSRVNIVNLKTDDNFMVEVSEDGRFKTNETLKDGVYLIEVLVPGYELVSTKVDLKGSAEVNFNLNPVGDVNLHLFQPHFGVSDARGLGTATLTPPHL